MVSTSISSGPLKHSAEPSRNAERAECIEITATIDDEPECDIPYHMVYGLVFVFVAFIWLLLSSFTAIQQKRAGFDCSLVVENCSCYSNFNDFGCSERREVQKKMIMEKAEKDIQLELQKRTDRMNCDVTQMELWQAQLDYCNSKFVCMFAENLFHRNADQYQAAIERVSDVCPKEMTFLTFLTLCIHRFLM